MYETIQNHNCTEKPTVAPYGWAIKFFIFMASRGPETLVHQPLVIRVWATKVSDLKTTKKWMKTSGATTQT